MAATAPSPRAARRAVPPEHRPVRAVTATPGERARPTARRLLAAGVLAVVLPLATAAALIPWREEHGRTLALVLVVPVALVAAVGTAGPGVLAALAAGLGYAFFLTAPYQHLRIEDADEVTATVTLIVVGILVGLLSGQITRLGSRASRRGEELQHVLAFATAVADPASTAGGLVDDASRHIAALLHLRSCTWVEGEHDAGRPLLTPSGDVMGRLHDLPRDRARLPETCELLAPAGPDRPARFVLEPEPASVVSFEERLTAATIASMCSAALAR